MQPETFQFSMWAMLLGVGVVQGLFLAGVLVLQTKGRRAANQALALLAFLLALLNLGYVVELSPLKSLLPFFLRWTGPFWLLLGPVFYGYVWLLTGRTVRFSAKTLLHLLPFCLHLFPLVHATLFPDSFRTATYRQYIYPTRGGGIQIGPLLFSNLFMVQTFVYAVLSSRLLTRYVATYKNSETRPQVRYLQWLRRLFMVFAGYIVYETIVSLILLFTGSLSPAYIYFSVFLLSSVLFVIVYTAIAHPDVLFPSLPEPEEKYQNSPLPDPYLDGLLRRLLALMEEQKPYLQGDLKLRDLADMLDISTHHLTQLLNQRLGKNFYDFVNAYRIEEVQRRLVDPTYQSFSILAIALDVGFNSKTTFNRLFKQHTETTPSQYRKTHLIHQKAA